MQNAAIASDASDSYVCVGCTDKLHILALGSRCSLNCSSLAGLRQGKRTAQGSEHVEPKQHPAIRHPSRPNASPIGIAKPAMSAAFQKGKPSRRSTHHATPDAAMSPP